MSGKNIDAYIEKLERDIEDLQEGNDMRFQQNLRYINENTDLKQSLTETQAKLDKAIQALENIEERFKTKGFDYHEEHPNLGFCSGGSRFATPKDIVRQTLKELKGE